MRRTQETAGDEAGQNRNADHVAEARLVERSRAATVSDLHRRAEDERTDH